MNESNAASKGTVLIVDDTPGNLAMLSDALAEADYRVLVATDGMSALEQIGYLRPDIVLLDVMMPGINGFETCSRLKSDPETAGIPIIFMTGLSELDDLLKGFDEGAVDYLVKPIRPPEVLARINAHLSHSRNLQRAEDGLNQVAFAVLTVDRRGQLTWLTPAAAKVLSDSYPETYSSQREVRVSVRLPLSLFSQLSALFEAAVDELPETAVRIGRDFAGKAVPGRQAGEYQLLIHKLNRDWDLDSLKGMFGLTPREAEILMWISRGKTNKEVGLILETSPRTVNKHLEHIFEKLGVPTRTAAVAKVLNTNPLA